MEAATFEVKFQDESILAHYVKEHEEAQTIVSMWMLWDPNTLYGLDTETQRLPEYAHIETAALSPHLGTIRLLQIYDGEQTYVFDLNYVDFNIFVPFLTTKRFVAHNALFDLSFLNARGVYNINIGCTYILFKIITHATYPLDTGLSASLEAITKALFNQEIVKVNQASDWSVDDLLFEQIEYSALDPICCYKIAEKLAPGLAKFGLTDYYSLLKKVQHPIAAMQMNGLAIDVEAHRVLIDEWRVDLWNANEEVLKITGLTKITPAKLCAWLEEVLDSDTISKWPRTPGGKLATNKEVFTDFSHIEVIAPYAVYQKKKTLTGTFGAGLLDRINPATNRLHGSYDICGARTGRLSSREPNLQNLPRDSSVRSHFVASPGYTFICADYNQIELRVAAELSQDPAMLEAYRNEWDLHSLTASTVSGIPFEEFELLKESDKEYYDDARQKAKAVNFGLLFGLGSAKFVQYAWQSYGVRFTDDEASDIISAWRELYAGYRYWQLAQASEASKTLEVRTPTGKLRRLPEDNTYGTSMNTPVQGGACEVMEFALVDWYKMSRFYPQAFLVNLVHDEILIECIDEHVDSVSQLLASCMRVGWRTVFPKGVITDKIVKVKTGANWQAAK